MAKNAFNQRKESLSKSLNKDIKKGHINGVLFSMQLKPGHRRKKISGVWWLLRCGCVEDGKDQLERHENK